MNIQPINFDHIMLYRLYNAYIQSYFINSFINSLIFFLEVGMNNDSAYDAQICGCRQNGGGYMDNKQNNSNNTLNISGDIDKQKTAIALSYDPAEAAPKIIASGKGYLAEKIIQKAKETDIPLHKDERLAGTLSKLDIGEMIPPQLYDVVAEILIFVDKMDRIKEKKGIYEQ